MRRTAPRFLTPLALLTCLGFSGCATITGGNPRTEMIVANHTNTSITVSYNQHEDNGDPTTIGTISEQVLPDSSIRYSGKAGDTVVVHVGDDPPLTLVFARRSQVLKVSESADGVAFNVKQGYTDPDQR